jgi:sugar phosphate isomerase/epimerase
MNVEKNNLNYGYSSMGYPDASLADLQRVALEFGLDFVELRALNGSTDLLAYFEAHPIVEDSVPVAPPVRLVAANLRLTEASDQDITDFLRYIDVAALVRAPYVRIFGGGQWGDRFSDTQMKHAARTVQRCRGEINDRNAMCEMIVETHSGFSSSDACLQLNDYLEDPLRILWDSHHTWRAAGESPAETWRKIGPLVRHIHFSDSRAKTSPAAGHDFVLPGSGEYPAQALRDLLSTVQCKAGVSLEWEKLWHPELPEIREALARFREVIMDWEVGQG